MTVSGTVKSKDGAEKEERGGRRRAVKEWGEGREIEEEGVSELV